jgi:hypothetical protein
MCPSGALLISVLARSAALDRLARLTTFAGGYGGPQELQRRRKPRALVRLYGMMRTLLGAIGTMLPNTATPVPVPT